jgi:thiol-disulfide isomerase/thioredoxin
MKNTVKWIIIAVLLVGILAGAMTLYNKYSAEYLNQGDEQQTSNTSTESTTEEANENSAPDFTVTDVDGNMVKLSDFKGKPVVLNFWATWCYYCKVEMPDFDEVAKANSDVHFLMVNATGTNGETVESAKAYIEEEKYEFPVFFDTDHDALGTYGVSSFPQTIFIDKDGNIVSHRIGMLTKDALEQEIQKIK